MAIGPGARIGPYEVISLLGEGGMGKVWRAHHLALGRDDALKVLPDAFAGDPERMSRFRREAQILASLNHPNIAHVYGFEGTEGAWALVMELVDGQTLAERLAEGPLPLDEALLIARHVAEALEAAHEQGIVHRDLKPANIKVRPDRTAKVLDFGLAKSLDPSADVSAQVVDAPTRTSPLMTQANSILGTVAYMSPEQARGRALDKRTDIWSFGCVFYEMLTGRRAFGGEDVTETLAAIARHEPDWTALPGTVPMAIRRLLRRCLDKDSRRRLRDIGEVRVILDDLGGDDSGSPAESGSQPWRWRWVLAAGLGVGLVGSAATGLIVWRARQPAPPKVSRLSILPPTDAAVRGSSLAISSDGNLIVYVSGDGTQLSVRALDELSPRHIRNLGAPDQPFISPDGQWIGFFDGLNELKKVPVTGGAAVSIASLQGSAPRGGSWSPDGTIIFATDDPATGLWRVPDRGGTPELLTTHAGGAGDHHWPHVLPDGRGVLFTRRLFQSGSPDEGEILALDLNTGDLKTLVPGSHPQYVSSGHLVYGDAGALRAVRFDPVRLNVLGTPASLLESISTSPDSALGVAVSRSGTLSYVSGASGGLTDRARRLVWVDREGNEEPLAAPPDAYVIARISPDGTRVAIDERGDSGYGLVIWDLPRELMTPFTFGVDAYPAWTPDGEHVAFTSFDAATGTGHLFWQRISGAGGPQRLEASPRSRYASSFTPDGTRLLYREEGGEGGLDIGVLPIGERQRGEFLIRTAFSELNPEVSPDGRWLAYESNRTGVPNIYVRPFPAIDAGQWQVSLDGGTQPAWARNGRELFYRARDGSVMAVPVSLSPTFSSGSASRVVKAGYFARGPFRSYEPSPDGTRFLMIKEGDSPAGMSSGATTIVVVLNWQQELTRALPEQ